jgi:hypothetical protein
MRNGLVVFLAGATFGVGCVSLFLVLSGGLTTALSLR